MASILRFRKLCFVEPVKCSKLGFQSYDAPKFQKEEKESVSAIIEQVLEEKKKPKKNRQQREWRCIDTCCWAIGYMCTAWWLLMLLYNYLPPNLTPESPGTRLRREGLTPLHPVVLVPGIVTGGLELWEGKPCSEGLFRKRLWGGGSFTEIFKRFELKIHFLGTFLV